MIDKEQALARLTALEEEAAALREILSAPGEPEPTPWERWKPWRDEMFFFVRPDGGVGSTSWCSTALDCGRRDFGNVFKTYEAAERHAKRLRSMVPTCAVPKNGDGCWVADYNGSPFPTTWGGVAWQTAAYNQGRIKLTREDAESWIAEFTHVWTTPEDAS